MHQNETGDGPTPKSLGMPRTNMYDIMGSADAPLK